MKRALTERTRRVPLGAALPVVAVVLAIAIVVAIGSGPIELTPRTVLAVAGHEILGLGPGAGPLETTVVMDLRMPRVLFGALTGAALAVSGAALQSLFRNPLADPGIIGVSAGASTGAVGAIVMLPPITGALVAWVVPASAFVGGLLATALIYALARPSAGTGTARLLLVGIAVGAAFSAATGFFTFAADDDELESVVFWQMGSLGSISWLRLAIVTLPVLLGLGLLMSLARRLDLLTLGERQAKHLGLDVNSTRRLVIVITALLTGATVAFTGTIGFIGLVVPHIVRLLCGPGHRALLPVSAVLGALLIVVADTLSRVVAPPAEVPIGLFTALMGAPFFLALVMRSRAVQL
ncbi:MULTISPECIES: FecCD family ABC transporter permease [Brachybacterium]|uniref:FecCD family ABC transporter permease n=1 Tax=Brachybacterium tyrofermentans TaxID=47848 RepID=A0ABW0FFN2_9MICO|nr:MULTISPECIES: iron ABC transporter permease [Brachybacterium]MDN5599752.1 iron ABC transporter permease [Brachybacterium sp.]MDN6301945.1 iron ABC transporter permease [Brachybacterium sp.]MDN6329655.1 iron ABC transporter permease [Brachybacterium sp.]